MKKIALTALATAVLAAGSILFQQAPAQAVTDHLYGYYSTEGQCLEMGRHMARTAGWSFYYCEGPTREDPRPHWGLWYTN